MTMLDLLAMEPAKAAPIPERNHIRNRVGWAMTYLTKAGLIHKVAPKLYEATGHGQEFLSSHPDRFGNRELRDIGAFREFQKSKRAEDGGDSDPPVAELSTPYERIDEALAEINADVRGQLISEILSKSPEFFERVVLDVLVAMGYGGDRQDAAEHLGGVGDEGLDGRINQDPLGLDVILARISDLAMVLYRQDKSPRLDFWGSDVRSHTTSPW